MRDQQNNQDSFVPHLIATSALLSAVIAILFYSLFLYVGTLQLFDLGLSEPALLLWDGMLSFLFFVQHSGMIRRPFRRSLSRVVPPHYNDAVFALTSGIALIATVAFWQSSETVVYELQGIVRWAARSVFFLAVLGMGWGVWALRSFDPFGRTAITDHLSGKPQRPQQFTVHGPYVWVRHPLYFLVLLLIWSCPDLTVDRLFFNFLWSAWIYVGTILEEKDLVSDFGEDYRQYKRKVPMLMPWKGPAYK